MSAWSDVDEEEEEEDSEAPKSERKKILGILMVAVAMLGMMWLLRLNGKWKRMRWCESLKRGVRLFLSFQLRFYAK